jgi:hypothetical protein
MPRRAGLFETEKAFMQAVLDLAKVYGWRVYHPYLSIRSAPGFVDIVAVRPPRLLMIELKSARGQLTSFQQAWLDDLRACDGVEVFIWRPDDWEDLVRVLKGAPDA